MLKLPGLYHFPASSACIDAVLVELNEREIQILASADQQVLWQGEDYHADELLHGLPLRLTLSDGAYFETPNPETLPSKLRRHRLLPRLERSFVLTAVALVAIPLLSWWGYFHGVPGLANRLVPHIPSSIVDSMDEQTLASLDQLLLEPSKLPETQQHTLRQQWLEQFAQSGNLALPVKRIEFRDAEKVGANAFALSGGTIVVTDQLVELLKTQPDALLAVLLHELGHVQYQHSLHMVAQSASNAIVLAVLFGDLGSMQELVVGAASSMVQASFSRDLEAQADEFAFQRLKQLGKSPTAFADALQAIVKSADIDPTDEAGVLKYFSSHPAVAERIKNASK